MYAHCGTTHRNVAPFLAWAGWLCQGLTSAAACRRRRGWRRIARWPGKPQSGAREPQVLNVRPLSNRRATAKRYPQRTRFGNGRLRRASERLASRWGHVAIATSRRAQATADALEGGGVPVRQDQRSGGTTPRTGARGPVRCRALAAGWPAAWGGEGPVVALPDFAPKAVRVPGGAGVEPHSRTRHVALPVRNLSFVPCRRSPRLTGRRGCARYSEEVRIVQLLCNIR